MKTKKTKEIDPKISQHFSNLGKASWEARKKAILEKLDKKAKTVS